jgi:PIN like domain
MLPPALASVLRTLEYDAIHLREHFAEDTKDEQWLPVVGKEGWAILTVDFRIANSRATQEILKAANTVAVFLFPSFQKMGRDKQVAWIIEHFADITKRVESTRPGTNLLIRQNGKIERLT